MRADPSVREDILRESRLRPLQIAARALVVVMFGVLSLVAGIHFWNGGLEQGRDASVHAAFTANKTAHGTFETARIAVDRIAEALNVAGDGSLETDGFGARIDAVLTETPVLRGAIVQNAAGIVVATGRPGDGLGRNLSVLDFFQELRQDPGRRYVLGRPYPSPVFGETLIPFARPLRAADGGFAGVVAVGLRLSVFAEMLPPHLAGTGAVARLWRNEGTLVAVVGERGVVAGDGGPDPRFLGRWSGDQDYVTYESIDADEDDRFVSMRRNFVYPIVSEVAIARGPYVVKAIADVAFVVVLGLVGTAVFLSLVVMSILRLAERERARAAIDRRERRIRHIVETVPGVVFELILDPRGTRFTWVGPRSRDIFGIEPDALIADPGLLRVHPQDRARLVDEIQAARAGETWSFTGRFLLPSGSERTLVVKAVPEAIAGGGLQAEGIMLDVTDDLRVRQEASATMARLSAIFETAEDAIVTVDAQGTIIDFNPAAERMFGWPRGEILGRNRTELFPAIPADRTQSWKRIELRHRDGRSFPAAISLGCFSANDAAYAVAIVHDMSDIVDGEGKLQAVNAELRRLLTAAEVANQAKSRFLAMMSHELRTPLNAVIGFSELIAGSAMGPHTNPKYAEYAADVVDAAQHLLSLVNDILDISRLTEGGASLAATEIRTASAVGRALRAVWPSVRAKRIRITAHSTFALPRLLGDQKAVHQVLLNLLSNAIKFSHSGRRLHITLAPVEGMIEIRVRDEGVGMSGDVLEQLGRPFVRGNDSYTASHSGVGLGIAISMSLVKAMGGTLTFDSAPGQGTTAVVRLPAERSGDVLFRN